MTALTQSKDSDCLRDPGAKSSIVTLLSPVDQRAQSSPNLIAQPCGHFQVGQQSYVVPRYVFVGPKAGADPIRIGLFAGIHGDEPEGAYALVQFLCLLDRNPELAAGYCLFVYPLCNPTGFEDNTRCSRSGRDLNREFWNGSIQPEIRMLQEELRQHAFHGIVSLHTDDTSHGVYGFVRGATLTQHLLKPALIAAEGLLPRNCNEVIDGFEALNGIIHSGYLGILSAPSSEGPKPFEIVLEVPQAAPRYQKERAFVAALRSILGEYRKLIAYAPNL